MYPPCSGVSLSVGKRFTKAGQWNSHLGTFQLGRLGPANQARVQGDALRTWGRVAGLAPRLTKSPSRILNCDGQGRDLLLSCSFQEDSCP